MKTYLLLFICAILQILHAGWCFLHSFSFPPDSAYSQVASPAEAGALLSVYEHLFFISASFTALFAALSCILLIICMVIRQRIQGQRLVRRVYLVCQGGIGLTGLLLAGIMLYSAQQGIATVLNPVAPCESTYWIDLLTHLRCGGIINGSFLCLMAGTCMVLCHLRFRATRQG